MKSHQNRENQRNVTENIKLIYGGVPDDFKTCLMSMTNYCSLEHVLACIPFLYLYSKYVIKQPFVHTFKIKVQLHLLSGLIVYCRSL